MPRTREAAMMSSHFYDALIAGGGPAGSAVAVALATEGRGVLLLERSRTAQHKACGEFLSPESLPFLRRMGIDPEKLGAQTIRSVRLAARDVLAEAELPATALSLTRRTLDEALLQCAQWSGASVLRGYQVESLSCGEDSNDVWRARATSAGAHAEIVVEGRDAFLATGKHDLRGWPRTARGVQGGLVAMKVYFVLTPEQQLEIAGNVELILFPGGYTGLQPVEGGWVNLCALITREKLRSLGGKWDGLLDHMQHSSTHLARRLSGARPVLEYPLALSGIPYGYCAPVSDDDASPWRLGDQAAVIPSFSGDGMAIALHTADRAAELYLEGATAAVFHAELRREFARRLKLATIISRLVIAVPSLAQAVRIWPSVLAGIFSATRVPSSGVQAVAQ
jgi:menaquinone-9 beta-reductase